MPFTFKLSKRLAILWRRRAHSMLLVLPLLPIKIDSLHLWLSAIFVAAWRTVRIECFCLECGDRRRSRLLGGARRRLCDQYACREFLSHERVCCFASLSS